MSARMQGSALEISPPGAERATSLAKAAEWARQASPVTVVDGAEHVIYGGRQEGKTFLATKWLNDTPAGVRRVLVTSHYHLAHIITANVAEGIDARAISFRHLLNEGAESGTEYGFDETLTILGDVFKLPAPPRLVTVMTAAPWQGPATQPTNGEPTSIALSDEPMLRFFSHEHLPAGPLQETSRLFTVVARKIVEDLPRSPERTVVLRKLLESKDAAVRAALDVPTD